MNPDAPLTPFVMPEYQVEARGEADRLEHEAEGWSATARRNIQRATNYVLVCCAVCRRPLLLRHEHEARSLRACAGFLLGLGVIIFVGTVGWLATFPISLTV